MSRGSKTKENAPKEKGRFGRYEARYRSAYPTPLFKFFNALLNLISVPLASFLVTENASVQNMGLFAAGIIGSLIALYGAGMPALDTNLKLRKVLIGFSTAFGVAVLIAISLLMQL